MGLVEVIDGGTKKGKRERTLTLSFVAAPIVKLFAAVSHRQAPS